MKIIRTRELVYRAISRNRTTTTAQLRISLKCVKRKEIVLLSYHLRRLVEAGRIKRVKVGCYRRS